MTVTDQADPPRLAKRIDTAYDKALRLSGVLQCVAHPENDNACNDGRIALVYLAEELADELMRHLDLTSARVAAAA